MMVTRKCISPPVLGHNELLLGHSVSTAILFIIGAQQETDEHTHAP